VSGKLSRRSFLKGAAGAGLAFSLPQGVIGCGSQNGSPGAGPAGKPPPVLFVSIDSLPPSYLTLNSRGERGGRDGDWLMPNLMGFLEESTLFAHARGYLPAATDMNHLNAVAGTSSAQTGVISVSVQPYNWNPDGTMRFEPMHVSWFRDDQGRPVDTLFNAWKQRWPDSKTMYIAGKFWVGEMFRSPISGVDIIATGGNHPGYVRDPEVRNFYDPPGDEDAARDPESLWQVIGGRMILMRDPVHFPSDHWIVDVALEVLRRERPDLGVILLAQMDDAQHSFGTLSDPDEFVPCEAGLRCEVHSARHPMTYREPILDAVRDVDNEFGRLMEGLRSIAHYRDATIVLYSDHGHINHLVQEDFGDSTDMVEILYREGLITSQERKGIGFAALGVSSVGGIWRMGDTLEERQAWAVAAKDALLRYEVVNPQTGERECPWFVGAHEDMIRGMPGYAEPGELWHAYYGPKNDRESMLWPDLVLGAKNGWQIPIYGGVLANIGIRLPAWFPPITLFLGGHGAVDTLPIVMAIRGPGVARGRVITDPGYQRNYRISDLAVTLARMYGLTLRTTTVGQDLTADLA
jgi:hypothetical protein